MGPIQKLTPGVTYQQKFFPGLGWDFQYQGAKKMVMKCLQNIVWISYHGKGLWNGVFTAITINKDVTVIRDSGPPKVNFWAQEEQCLLSFSHQAAAPIFSSCHCLWCQGTKYMNNQIAGCWPQIAEMHMKKN